jgi:malonate transporter and related proteins
MQQILGVTVPFFALVLCGYLAALWRVVPLEAIPGLNVFVLFFALPCLLYQFASSTPIVRLLDVGVCITYCLSAVTMVAVTVATTRRRAVGWGDASFGALAAAFPNSAFMGMPILVALLGARAASPAITSLAIDMVLTSSICIALAQLDSVGHHGAGRAAVQLIRGTVANPLPWAIVLGCLSSATGLQLPQPPLRAVDMLARAASPAALFTIGAVLRRSQLAVPSGQGRQRDVPLLVFYKLIAHPALVFTVGTLLPAIGIPLDAFSLSVLVLVAAMPSANNVPILAERFGADAGRVAGVVLLTTTLAFATIPAAVAVLNPPKGLHP